MKTAAGMISGLSDYVRSTYCVGGETTGSTGREPMCWTQEATINIAEGPKQVTFLSFLNDLSKQFNKEFSVM